MRRHHESILGNKRYFIIIALVTSALAWQATQSSAQIVTLTDGNSTAQVNLGNQQGMFNWFVDGQSELAQQWFWYRVGTVGGEHSIDTISAPAFSQADARDVSTIYNNGLYSVEVDYKLTGGLPGSGQADIGESIKINNLTANPLDFHFFQYANFDLAGSPGGDTTQLKFGPNQFYVADQNKGSIALQETVNTPAANHGEAATAAGILVELNDGNPTTLSDSAVASTTNNAYALEWDTTIGAGSSFLISKDKKITLAPIPEPAVLGLGVLSLFALVLRKRAV